MLKKIDVSLLGYRKKYWIKRFSSFDWVTIQDYYNKGNTLKKVYTIFNLSRTTVNKAVVVGLFKKDKRIYKTSKETKQKLSKIRKAYLKNNPDKHPWKKSTKFKSVPCEKIKKGLLENKISFVEEYTPLKDRFFSIDIAFPNEKIGIEINGNQHYERDGSLKKYYKERHDLLVENGWKIYEIHYMKAYDTNFLTSLCQNFTKLNLDKYTTYTPKIKKKGKTSKCVDCNIFIWRGSTRCNSCSGENKYKNKRKNMPSYQTLVMEIQKTSYVKVGKKYDVSHTTIKNWLKKYLGLPKKSKLPTKMKLLKNLK